MREFWEESDLYIYIYMTLVYFLHNCMCVFMYVHNDTYDENKIAYLDPVVWFCNT